VNVQFFGAHTAHEKISRGEIAALPMEEQAALRDALVGLAGMRRGMVVRRKLYWALVPLALRLVPAAGGDRNGHGVSGQSAWEGTAARWHGWWRQGAERAGA
jgi:hypothetical protein